MNDSTWSNVPLTIFEPPPMKTSFCVRWSQCAMKLRPPPTHSMKMPNRGKKAADGISSRNKTGGRGLMLIPKCDSLHTTQLSSFKTITTTLFIRNESN